MESLDIKKIFEYLPQRYPFLMIDRVLSFTVEESLTAIKNVTINEPYFVGHFPGLPIMPGVMIVETLAQACGILAVKTALNRGLKLNGGVYYFAGIENARFKKPVVPGDQLQLQVKLLNDKRNIWKFAANAFVDQQIACEATLTSAWKEV